MAIDRLAEQKSIHRLAFDHYLRTGQRLTSAEWLAHERKFNPYHDELGRFTSPPGVTVSWGGHERSPSGERGGPRAGRPDAVQSRRRRVSSDTPRPANEKPSDAESTREKGAIQSDFVRERTVQGGYADTYFELRKRQAGLNRLREAAGPNPSAAVRADLDEIQARLDANRLLLAERGKTADGEIVEAFRSVNPLIDVGAATVNIAHGEGDLDDAITLATNTPLLKPAKLVGGGIVAGLARGRLGKQFATSPVTKDTVHTVINGTIQRGGSHRNVTRISGHEAHHIPQRAASPLSKGNGPAIAMEQADHRALASSKNSKDSLRRQKAFIEQGDYRSAMEIEISDIRRNFGDKYDDAIEQMLSYSRSQGLIK